MAAPRTRLDAVLEWAGVGVKVAAFLTAVLVALFFALRFAQDAEPYLRGLVDGRPPPAMDSVPAGGWVYRIRTCPYGQATCTDKLWLRSEFSRHYWVSRELCEAALQQAVHGVGGPIYAVSCLQK
jgi:hypothetical protein